MLVVLLAAAALSLGCASTDEPDAGSAGTSPDSRTTSGGPAPSTPTCATGGHAVLEPPGREPLVLAVLTRGGSADAEPRDALVAEAARIALDAVCAER